LEDLAATYSPVP